MKEPVPEDFGLTSSEIKRLEQDEYRKENLWVHVGWSISLVGFILIVGLIYDRTELSVLGDILFGIILSLFMLFPAMLVALALQGVVSLVWGKDRRLMAYRDARREWVDRVRMKEAEWRLALNRQKRDWWRSLDGWEFEQEVTNLLRDLGYQAYVTPRSGDDGLDVMASKDGDQVGVQCKAHGKPVGPRVVRELLGALASRSDVQKAILVALSGTTDGATRLARRNGIEVWDGQRLIQESTIYNISTKPELFQTDTYRREIEMSRRAGVHRNVEKHLERLVEQAVAKEVR